MTISADEFEQGKSKSKQYKAIEKCLKEDPDNAYTIEEILRTVFNQESSTEHPDNIPDVSIIAFITPMLHEMISKRKITSKFANGVPYFKWRA